MAQSCQLGEASYFAMAAIVCYFISLILVCTLSPKKRKLDENYGEENAYVNGNNEELDTSLDDDNVNDIDFNLSNIQPDESFLIIQKTDSSDYAPSLAEGRSFEYSFPVVVSNDAFVDHINSTSNSNNNNINDIEQGIVQEGLDLPSASLTNSSFENENNSSTKAKYIQFAEFPPVSGVEDELSEATRVVSEARLAKADDMQFYSRTASNELIDKCILDLTRSFQSEELELFEADPDSDSEYERSQHQPDLVFHPEQVPTTNTEQKVEVQPEPESVMAQSS